MNNHKPDDSKSYLYAEIDLACIHKQKQYDDTAMCLSYPPKRRWTCKECGEVGYETIGYYKEGNI